MNNYSKTLLAAILFTNNFLFCAEPRPANGSNQSCASSFAHSFASGLGAILPSVLTLAGVGYFIAKKLDFATNAALKSTATALSSRIGTAENHLASNIIASERAVSEKVQAVSEDVQAARKEIQAVGQEVKKTFVASQLFMKLKFTNAEKAADKRHAEVQKLIKNLEEKGAVSLNAATDKIIQACGQRAQSRPPIGLGLANIGLLGVSNLRQEGPFSTYLRREQ
jgi:hypothetical protein